jgi:cytoskeletal protein RodZ
MSMLEEFKLKKVAQETLGEYLYSVRQDLGLSIEEVAKQTGVFEKFLAALESSKYHQLPPDVYVLGFLKKIAEVYKISCTELVEQFKKERNISEQTALKRIVPAKGLKSYISRVSITPKFITISVGVLLAFSAGLYILVQVFSVNRTPSLTILSPVKDSVLKGSSVEIKGQTEPGITVSVNGQNILVQPDGSFASTLSVVPGQKDLHLVATNKFGKSKSENISFKIDEPQVAGEVTEQPTELLLELTFTKATTINVKRDGVELPEEIVPSGAKKKIIAADKIELTTSDAGSTIAKFNNLELGALGKKGQSLTVPFSHKAESLLKPSAKEDVITNTDEDYQQNETNN